jgi:hypothetical protein
MISEATSLAYFFLTYLYKKNQMLDINRYLLISNGGITPPFIKIPEFPDDKYEIFRGTSDTMIDALSDKHYGSSLLSWVIMYANPQYMNEADPEIGDYIRIPYPLDAAVEAYEKGINDLRRL